MFVGNLNFRTTKDELSALLVEAGEIVDVYLPSDRQTGRPRGFAFVEFTSEASAAEAIRLFDGRELAGRKLNVNAADDRPRRRFASPAGPPSGDFGQDGFGRDRRPPKNKGSRRGLRRRKRSL